MLVDSIQILSLPAEKITEELLMKLNATIDNILDYGSPQQLAIIAQTLKKHSLTKKRICAPLMGKIEEFINAKRMQDFVSIEGDF